MGFWGYCFGWQKLNIKPGELVLEIGPGGKPMIRSDVLVDKFLTDSVERGADLVIDRPFVVADVCALPFKDKSFDYAYTAHTLEHVDDIKSALSELARVAKKGCIVVPHWHWEGCWNYPFHRRLISVRNNKIVFRRKCTLFEIDEAEARSETKQLIWRLISRNLEAFEVRYEWHGRVEYEIIRCGCPDFVPKKTASVKEVRSKPIPLKGRFKRWGRIIVTRILRWFWMKLGWLPRHTASQNHGSIALYGRRKKLTVRDEPRR
ncbi:MAG: methyltransferase domain-containing protein [Armatimonadetes bacterium]|nr:methyltransferase domain-containing protein [Armatimonadota bacterium]MDW8029320.1 methyltransferase domain-containing protein [Armatimonadota bacterium]